MKRRAEGWDATRAVRHGDHYLISGRKIWTSTAQVAEKMLILARTTPRDAVAKPSLGMTLFYTDLDRGRIEVREIAKMGRMAVDSNLLFIDGLEVPAADRIGEEGRGFQCILRGMNPERILIAAEAVGLGRAALDRAARYAKERVVFGRPIGQNQGIQHPLAERWVELEAAELMVRRAAAAYDAGEEAGAFANAAKYCAAEAGFRAFVAPVPMSVVRGGRPDRGGCRRGVFLQQFVTTGTHSNPRFYRPGQQPSRRGPRCARPGKMDSRATLDCVAAPSI